MAGPNPQETVDRRRFLGGLAAGTGALLLGGCQTAAGPEHAEPPRRARDLPGTDAWRLTDPGPDEAVAGFADRVSVRPGEEFTLRVSTTARRFRVLAFRVGWYEGGQASLVWRSGPVPGRRQAEPGLDQGTRTVRARWRRSLTVGTDGWPEGAYLLRLDADNGHQRYVPLVVRSTHGAGRTVLVHAAATWQAYNRWGGCNLYQGRDGQHGTRSLVVSFDRPYDASGAEKFLVYERALVVLAERLGIPLAYTTGLDVDEHPDVLSGARAVVILGHDEYWTPHQRRVVTRARDAGTNVAVLGANTCFRRISVDADRRSLACFKSSYRLDPNFLRHPSLVTTDFRAGPGADPESSLTGVLYEGFPTDAPYVVRAPHHWLFEGTGVRDGDSFDHLVGVEYDRVTPDAPTPGQLEVVAHSPLRCKGRASHHDSAYYTVDSGAGVFATGTMRWVEALMAGTRDNGRNHGLDARTGAFVTRTTENVLRDFAAGPAARHRPPAEPNVDRFYPPR